MEKTISNSEKLKKLIKNNLKNDKLSCFDAFTIHHTTGASLQEIGSIVDEMKVKIFACQLGCF